MNQLTTIASLPSGAGCAAALPAERGVLPQVVYAGGPWHHIGDGRGARDVYVDGVLVRHVTEAHTAEGWAIVMRSARPENHEFSPSGMQETLRGKVEVFPTGTRGA